MLIDSHCHLNYPELEGDLQGVLTRAKNAGVQAMLSISTRMDTLPAVLSIVDQDPRLFATVGVHPHEVEEEGVPSLQELIEVAESHPKVIGLGETGLDYYYEHSNREAQKESFSNHIMASLKTELPLVIHSRNAEDDILELLRTHHVGGGVTPGVIHCFSGTKEFAEAALDMGFYISISGILTFKNATQLREIVKNLPLEKLLVETDAPYLAPVPKRGKPNEPSFVRYTAEALAQLKNVSLTEVADITTKNFYTVFPKALVCPQE